MSIPPWIVALIVLIVASGVGAYIVKDDYGFEGFGSAISQGLTLSPGNSQGEGFTSVMSSRNYIVPPLKNPHDDKYLMQPYGLHDRQVQRSGVRGGGDPIFNYNPAGNDGFRDADSTSSESDAEGLDQNINEKPLPYAGVTGATGLEDSPVKQQLASAQNFARGTIPTDQNLAMISGGSGESADTPLTQGYEPHQEKIYPDQHPRPAHAQVTAGVPTDAGTVAEQIQKNSTRMPSVREMVREEERRESESFNNPYAVRYQAV